MEEEYKNQEVPFDMSKETLKSIREWIDKITQISIGIIGGNKIGANEIIVIKHKMIKQLIVLSTPLMQDEDLAEIEEFFNKIKIKIGDIKIGTTRHKNVPIYSKDTEDELDECTQAIEKALKKYFVPEFRSGERY